jgi:tetratricopeptide (TPR) repeat protein
MAREYRKREEENELIKRFEEHLRKKKSEFFDLDAYEQIIDYYMFRGKHNKALQAVNLAIGQYPFSIELISIKAQILSNLEEFEEALLLLDKAHAQQPNDPEIFLTTGSILSLQGHHAEAI